jgi:acetylornithine deacetylase
VTLEDQIARVTAAIADRRDDIAELTQSLVRFDTTARAPEDPARDEAALQAVLADRLRAAGADVNVWEPAPDSIRPWASQVSVESLSFQGRPQLVARFAGAGGGRSMAFNGHIDAVAADPVERWSSNPFEARIVDGRIVGRGACDMKGGIAAMVVAAETVMRELGTLPGDLLINTVTDEESSGAGALACIAGGLTADAVIVPEPTSFDVWVACRGSLTPVIEVTGRPGHAELTQPHWRAGGAVNAIEKLGVVIDAVRALREEWRTRPDQMHPHLSPGTVTPVLVDGGEWFVTYPASARLTCELMYLPGTADADGQGSIVAKEFEDWIARAGGTDPWLAENPARIVDWGSDIPPAEIDGDHPLAQTMLGAVREVGAAGRIAGFDSWHDGASFVRCAKVPAVAFGPPGVERAHVIDESVSIDDLVTTAQALAAAAVRWCSA